MDNPRFFGPPPRRMFGLSPPRGAPRLGAKAGDAKHRKTARPKLGQDLTMAGRTPPPREARNSRCARCETSRASNPKNYSSPLAGRRQRKELRAPSSSSPRPGWRGLARPKGSQLLDLPTNSRMPDPRKLLRPTVIGRAPWEILPFQLIVETQYFPLKAWRADSLQAVLCPRAGGNWSKQLCVVWPISYSSSRARLSYPDHAGTALRPGRPRLRRGGAPIGRFIGHPAEKNGQRQPLQNARWAGPTEPGENPAKERITQIL